MSCRGCSKSYHLQDLSSGHVRNIGWLPVVGIVVLHIADVDICDLAVGPCCFLEDLIVKICSESIAFRSFFIIEISENHLCGYIVGRKGKLFQSQKPFCYIRLDIIEFTKLAKAGLKLLRLRMAFSKYLIA